MSICPFNCCFSDVRIFLLDPRNQTSEARQQLTVVCLAGKMVSAAGIGIGGLGALSNLISCISYPIFGSFGLAFWGATFLLGLEAFTITKNIEDIGSSIPNRVANAVSASIFVNSLFKKTIVIGPVFTEAFIELLNTTKK